MQKDVFQKLFFVLLAFMLCGTLPVFAEDDSLETLGFIDTHSEPPASTSRLPRPTSKIAENVTVITAADIERLNAHTLAEVLQTVPGIQLDYIRTPSTFAFFSIQGAISQTVLVLVDGIRQNDYDQNMISPGTIPVQHIERIEIVKGSASTAWGSALGGVVNIITKSPNQEQPVSGMVSGSIGSQFTADSRAELSGTLNRFGYYLTAGHLRSDGFSPNTAANQNNLYGKISYLLPNNGTATLGLSHLKSQTGLDEADTTNWGFVHDNMTARRTNAFLKFNQPLGSNLTLDIDGYVTDRDDHTKFGGRDGQGAITFFNDYTAKDASRGANARLTWGDSQRNLVTGLEYTHVQASYRDIMSTDPPTYDRSWDRWALYANGAYSIGELTILPGVRFDDTGIAGNTTSYSLGATYQLAEKTTFRAYAANGYSLPIPRSPGKDMLQKIRTIQGGIESSVIPYLWLKGTYFNNNLHNSISAGANTITNQNREGFEIEARTIPFYGVSLNSGYTYLYVKNNDTGERLQTDSNQTVPPHVVKLALNYDNTNLGLRGTLTGNYVWWNSPAGYPSRSAGMVWDLHLNWKLKPISGLSPELFFSGHNLLDAVQTTYTPLYPNAARWFEGGMRVNF